MINYIDKNKCKHDGDISYILHSGKKHYYCDVCNKEFSEEEYKEVLGKKYKEMINELCTNKLRDCNSCKNVYEGVKGIKICRNTFEPISELANHI